MIGCAECTYCVEGLRDEHDELCVACTKMPSNEPWGCGYFEIDGIDYVKERMWFCPLKEREVSNKAVKWE